MNPLPGAKNDSLKDTGFYPGNYRNDSRLSDIKSPDWKRFYMIQVILSLHSDAYVILSRKTHKK